MARRIASLAALAFAVSACSPAASPSVAPASPVPTAPATAASASATPSASASASSTPEAVATSAPPASPPTSPPPSPSPASAGRPTPVPPSQPPAQSDVEVKETGFTAFHTNGNDFASYGAILRNPDPHWSIVRMEIHVDFYGTGDTFLAGDDVTITIRPGATIGIAGQVFGAGRAVRVEVNPPEDTVSYQQVPPSTESMRVKNVSTRRINGSYVTTGTVVSTFSSDQSPVELTAVYRDARGRIIGGATGGAQTVPAGGTAPFEIVDGSPYPAVATADVYWHEGL
jgi:hypothetical protein